MILVYDCVLSGVGIGVPHIENLSFPSYFVLWNNLGSIGALWCLKVWQDSPVKPFGSGLSLGKFFCFFCRNWSA